MSRGLEVPPAVVSVGDAPGEGLVHEFPGAFHAYWVRFTARAEARVTAQLTYR